MIDALQLGTILSIISMEDDVNNTELLPCPSCGTEPILMVNGSIKPPVWRTIQARCIRCDISSDKRNDEAEAIEAWNRKVSNGHENGQ